MIEIKHKHTGVVLRRIEVETPERVHLHQADLQDADLAGARLRKICLEPIPVGQRPGK
jgi:hypothetical protein